MAAKQPAAAREQNAQWLATVKIVLSARLLAKNALWLKRVAANRGKKCPVAAVKIALNSHKKPR